MPSFFTAPLLGSSFDALNAQRFGWTNRNDQIEAANLARAAAVQEAQNRWLANSAAMQQAAQQRNVELQLSQDATLRQEAWRQRQAEEDAQRWSEDLAWRRQSEANRLAEERFRSQVMGDRDLLRDRLAREQMTFDIDQTGQGAAQQLAALKRQYEKAQSEVAALEDEQKTLEKSNADIDAVVSKRWIRGANEEEKAKREANDMRLMEIKKLVAPRSELVKTRDRAENAYDRYREQFLGSDFSIDDDTSTIRHKGSGKSWSFAQAVKEATPVENRTLFSPMFTGLAATGQALAEAPRFAAFNTAPAVVAPAVTATATTPAPAMSMTPGKKWIWDRKANRPVLVQQ